MADRVRVTVAPGAHITISPHPSGLVVLKHLVLFGGNTCDVTPERAAALYAAGLILHPVTGQMPPRPKRWRSRRGRQSAMTEGHPGAPTTRCSLGRAGAQRLRSKRPNLASRRTATRLDRP